MRKINWTVWSAIRTASMVSTRDLKTRKGAAKTVQSVKHFLVGMRT